MDPNYQEVLASSLLPISAHQRCEIAYSETEGYVPVGRRYVSGIQDADNGTHYAVKIEASKLLLDDVDNTFVTPY